MVMEETCEVKHCRATSVLSHLPLKMRLCRKHWEAHCDGAKLEKAK